MKNIKIISHILFELTLATCISKAKIGKFNTILKKFKINVQPCELSLTHVYLKQNYWEKETLHLELFNPTSSYLSGPKTLGITIYTIYFFQKLQLWKSTKFTENFPYILYSMKKGKKK